MLMNDIKNNFEIQPYKAQDYEITARIGNITSRVTSSSNLLDDPKEKHYENVTQEN